MVCSAHLPAVLVWRIGRRNVTGGAVGEGNAILLTIRAPAGLQPFGVWQSQSEPKGWFLCAVSGMDYRPSAVHQSLFVLFVAVSAPHGWEFLGLLARLDFALGGLNGAVNLPRGRWF